MERIKINELIVVEGNDDISAVKKAVDAEVLAVHGFSVFAGREMAIIRSAEKRCGVIILTDPDHAGNRIRERILKEVPDAKQAFITRKEGMKDGNIGIENASPETIIRALKKAHARTDKLTESRFDINDMYNWQLTGSHQSRQNRTKAGKILGLGYANSTRFLSRLNHFGISRKELERALEQCGILPASRGSSASESAATAGKPTSSETAAPKR